MRVVGDTADRLWFRAWCLAREAGCAPKWPGTSDLRAALSADADAVFADLKRLELAAARAAVGLGPGRVEWPAVVAWSERIVWVDPGSGERVRRGVSGWLAARRMPRPVRGCGGGGCGGGYAGGGEDRDARRRRLAQALASGLPPKKVLAEFGFSPRSHTVLQRLKRA